MPDLARVTTSDGVTLVLRRFAPSGTPVGKALVTHAMMANGSYQERFAAFLAARGVETFVLDFRGHGLSVPPRPADPPGWSFDAYVEADLPAAVKAVGDDYVYVGHSLGGLAGVAAIGSGRIRAPRRLVLVTTSVRSRAPTLIGEIFDWGSRAIGHLPIRRLRIGTDDEPRAYALQYATWTRTRRWTSWRGEDYAAAARNVTAPCLALVASQDRLAHEDDQRAFAASLGGPVEVWRLPVDHFRFFKKETRWDEVARRIILS